MIVLLDIVVVLVLILAARSEDRTVQVNVGEFPSYGISEGVTLIARSFDGSLELLEKQKWVPVELNEEWREEMLTTDCDERCEPFRQDNHKNLEFLIVGRLASSVAVQHANLCRVNSQTCMSAVHNVSPTGYSYKK
jgi:hypothetical protein